MVYTTVSKTRHFWWDKVQKNEKAMTNRSTSRRLVTAANSHNNSHILLTHAKNGFFCATAYSMNAILRFPIWLV